jgi:predicted nuclease with TOPRIM domain
MATPERTAASRRLQNAARAERARLRRELDRHEQRMSRLRTEMVELEQNANAIREQLALLAQVAHDEGEDSPFSIEERALRVVEPTLDQPHLTPPHGYLRGADIRIAAVRVLASTENPSKPTHYADWYRLVIEAGFGIAGRDPLATFLTQIGRSPLVDRASERGLYALNLDVLPRLRERLHGLHRELAGLHEGQQTIEEIATVATRRAELTAAAVKVERELEEALVSLGYDTDEPA